ncbi:MAG: sugar ABC transporter substrate-binding protein, partial [Thermotogae bacterium]
ARPFPSHPEFSKYNSLIYDAISGIETGKLTPEEALEFVIKRAKAEIKDVIVK